MSDSDDGDVPPPPRNSPNLTPRKGDDNLRRTFLMQALPSGLTLEGESMTFNANEIQYEIVRKRTASFCYDYNALFPLVDGMDRAIVLSK